MAHDPHVIKKVRDGGTRHGEVTYYAVGWQRSTRSAAREDLYRFLVEREEPTWCRCDSEVRCLAVEDLNEPWHCLNCGRDLPPNHELRSRLAELSGKVLEAIIEHRDASQSYQGPPPMEIRTEYDRAMERSHKRYANALLGLRQSVDALRAELAKGEKKMAETVMVMFETDDYRGDHAAERRVMREFDPMARLADVLEQANALKTTHGDRATVTILPEVLEKEVAGG